MCSTEFIGEATECLPAIKNTIPQEGSRCGKSLRRKNKVFAYLLLFPLTFSTYLLANDIENATKPLHEKHKIEELLKISLAYTVS